MKVTNNVQHLVILYMLTDGWSVSCALRQKSFYFLGLPFHGIFIFGDLSLAVPSLVHMNIYLGYITEVLCQLATQMYVSNQLDCRRISGFTTTTPRPETHTSIKMVFSDETAYRGTPCFSPGIDFPTDLCIQSLVCYCTSLIQPVCPQASSSICPTIAENKQIEHTMWNTQVFQLFTVVFLKDSTMHRKKNEGQCNISGFLIWIFFSTHLLCLCLVLKSLRVKGEFKLCLLLFFVWEYELCTTMLNCFGWVPLLNDD